MMVMGDLKKEYRLEVEEIRSGTPWESLGQIIGPHLAHMIPASLPGGGNILVFSNGGVSRFGSQRDDCPGTYPNAMSDYSRVVEFNPITYEVVWEYKNPTEFTDADDNLNRRFYSTFMCGAQRLENGNTLITETGKERVFEVTREGEIVGNTSLDQTSLTPCLVRQCIGPIRSPKHGCQIWPVNSMITVTDTPDIGILTC